MSDHAVFISYSSKDVVIAKQVLDYLEGNGIACWMAPRNIIPGEHYASSILEAIKNSKAFFLLFSPYSDASEQCLKEVDRAVNARIPIIPFRIVEHTPTEAMEYYLCNTHWMDAFKRPTGEYFPQLLNTCKRILDGKIPEVARPSRPQKALEEMSEGMRAMIQRVETEAEKEEAEGQRFKKQSDANDPDKTSPMQNPFKQGGLKSIEGGKVDRSYAPQVEAKKKKPALQVIEKNKPAPTIEPIKQKRKIEMKSLDEIGREHTKKKKKLPVLFILVLFGGGGFLYVQNMTGRRNEIKSVSDNIRALQKNVNQQSSVKEVNYDYLSSTILTGDDLNFKSDDELANIRSMIISKNGDLFVKQGGSLIEKEHNRMEINNLALLDSREHEKRVNRLKGIQSRNMDLENVNTVFYFEPMAFDSDRQTEASWKFHADMLMRMVRSHKIQSKTTKNHPDQADWNSNYLREKGHLVVSLSLVPAKEPKVEIQIVPNSDKVEDLQNFADGLTQSLAGLIQDVQIVIDTENTREVSKIDVAVSLGENLKEAQNSEVLQEIEDHLAKSLAVLAK